MINETGNLPPIDEDERQGIWDKPTSGFDSSQVMLCRSKHRHLDQNPVISTGAFCSAKRNRMRSGETLRCYE